MNPNKVMHGPRKPWYCLGLVVFWSTSLPAAEAVTPFPYQADAQHLGVATCASSNCHGAADILTTTAVRQNEYLTWQREDAHAGAYRLLFNEESQEIARRLGIGKAHEAEQCLACHSDHLSAQQQGYRFQISDGIGCEACHGGSEHWIESHTAKNRAHADNLADGLYPLDQPEARARLCLSCHFGNSDKPMTHEMLGAGHPPLLFELDTFTAIQPAHFTVDADYASRGKVVSNSLALWTEGQLQSAAALLNGLADTRWNRSQGAFPEFYFYQCEACHHGIDAPNWKPEPGTGTEPGLPPLADAPLRMLEKILNVVDAEQAEAFYRENRRLQRAVTVQRAELPGAVTNLHARLRDARASIQGTQWNQAALLKTLSEVSGLGSRFGRFRNHMEAEQIVMGLAVLVTHGERKGMLTADQLAQLGAVLDKLYDRIESRAAYRPDSFQWTLAEFNKLAGCLAAADCQTP